MQQHASNKPQKPEGFVDIGELIVCKCGIPLGRRKDRNTISVSKPVKGGPAVHIKVEYQGGSAKVSCPLCGFGAIFQHFEETTGIQDGVATKTESDRM